jgi:hypothetical protein
MTEPEKMPSPMVGLITNPGDPNRQRRPGQRGAKFTPGQREGAIARTAHLYLTGHTLRQIADDIGVAYASAANYMRILEKRWKERSESDYALHKAKEIAKLDKLEATYWEAWNRSLDESKKIERIIEPRRNKDGQESLVQKRQKVNTEETTGDPRFLDGVFKCIDRRIKMLGLDAAERDMMEKRGGSDNALEERLRQYSTIFGAAIVGYASGHLGHDDLRESLDSERSAPETNGVLDVSYVER